MLNVADGGLVIEEKGIYSVEKFLVARRFMYWQVYLHKTGIVAEQILINVLRRAKELQADGLELEGSEALLFFMKNTIDQTTFSDEVLQTFSELDDIDILSAIKKWQYHSDFVLSQLSRMILHRELLNIKIKDKPINELKFANHLNIIKERYKISNHEAAYFVFTGTIQNRAYDDEKENINILKATGKIVDVARASDHLNLKALSQTVTKHYICYPKE